jgi:hypothetical protein
MALDSLLVAARILAGLTAGSIGQVREAVPLPQLRGSPRDCRRDARTPVLTAMTSSGSSPEGRRRSTIERNRAGHSPGTWGPQPQMARVEKDRRARR